MSPQPTAVECTLDEAEREERAVELRTTLGQEFLGVDELTTGYRFHFQGADDLLARLASFISRELQCCSFANFTISVSPPYEETHLTINGPEGTKSLLGEAMIDLLSNPPANADHHRPEVRSKYTDIAGETSSGCCAGSVDGPADRT